MAKKNAQKKAADYVKSIKKYLEHVGRLEQIDSFALESLEKAYRTLLLAEEDVEATGILTTNRFGDKISNPSIKIANDSRIQINKLLENMDITHKQRYKKVVETEDDTEFEQFLKGE